MIDIVLSSDLSMPETGSYERLLLRGELHCRNS